MEGEGGVDSDSAPATPRFCPFWIEWLHKWTNLSEREEAYGKRGTGGG